MGAERPLTEHGNPDNLNEWRGVYAQSIPASFIQPLVSRAWTNEIEPPWRMGRGLAIRYRPSRVLVVGRFKARQEARPGSRALAVPPPVINSWKGGLPVNSLLGLLLGLIRDGWSTLMAFLHLETIDWRDYGAERQWTKVYDLDNFN